MPLRAVHVSAAGAGGLRAVRVLPGVQIFILSFQQYSFVHDAGVHRARELPPAAGDSVFRFALLNSFLYLLVTPFLIVVSLAVAFLINAEGPGDHVLPRTLLPPGGDADDRGGYHLGMAAERGRGARELLHDGSGLTDSKIYWLTTTRSTSSR
jgi:hypothetical protein